MKDPFVTEIRKYRMAHTKKFNSDIHAICNDIRNYQNTLYSLSDIDENKKFTNKGMYPTSLRSGWSPGQPREGEA